MVKAYYKNSRGEVLWLTKAPFRTVEADWFDSTWEEKDGGYEKTITIDVVGKRNEFVQNMETLYKIISVDSETGNYGQLYVNDTFLPCQIYETKKTGWKGYVYTEVELKFVAPELSWITVLNKRFFSQEEIAADSGLDFDYDFPFDFMNEKRGSAEFETQRDPGHLKKLAAGAYELRLPPGYRDSDPGDRKPDRSCGAQVLTKNLRAHEHGSECQPVPDFCCGRLHLRAGYFHCCR